MENASKNAITVQASQIDIVIDFYHDFSIKSTTRTSRGTSSILVFNIDDNVPDNIMNLLKNDQFKTDLNAMLTDLTVLQSWTKDFCITKGDFVLERISGVVSERLICTQSVNTSLEEADNRIVLHIRDSIILRNRYRILVRTVDSDVVIILLAYHFQFQHYDDRLYLCIDFGVGTERRCINMNECFQNIGGEQYALAMPFFHTFTGSDSTSAFYQKSKLMIHSKWMESPFEDDVMAAFQRLSWCATESTIDDCIPVINKFIVFVYGGINITLNSYRFLLFKASSSNNLRIFHLLKMDLNFISEEVSIRQTMSGETPLVNFQHLHLKNVVGL